MRKVILLLTISVLVALTGRSQAPYYCITETAPNGGFGAGYQTFSDGTTVTIRRTGGGFGCPSGQYQGYPAATYPAPASAAGAAPFGYCGIGSYFIGNNGCDNGWRFDFSQQVTNVRIRFTSLNDSDSIRIRIPPQMGPGFGTTIPVTTAMLNTWSSSCNGGNFAVAAPNGKLSANGAPSGFSDVEVNLQNPFSPYTLSRLQIDYSSTARNTDGVVFEICYKIDSCALRFNVTADSPRCIGRDLNLHAFDFPNTTHYWRSVAPLLPAQWTASGPGLADPTVPAITLFHAGLYIDSAVRGVCTYIDTVNILVDVVPPKPTMTYKGPKCPGEPDTVDAVTSLPGGGDYYFYSNAPNWPTGVVQKPPIGTNYLEFPSIQLGDAGRYWSYAQSINGCISDTAFVDVLVNPPATAAFTFTVKEGCDGDTVLLNNISIPSTPGTYYGWDMGVFNGQFQSYQPDTMFIYRNHPTPPITYNIKLTVGNGSCQDDTSLNITFNRPLVAGFNVSDSAICQYNTIKFINASQTAPATIPNYRWLFGDGDSSTAVIEVDHKYDKVGLYNAFLEVTDYLGCKDTFTKEILVDSVGSIAFETPTDVACAGEVIKLFGSYSPVGINDAVWDFGDGLQLLNQQNAEHSYERPGTYTVSFSADYRICPDTTYKIDVNITPFPIVDLGADTTICPNGQPVLLTPVVTGTQPEATYRWNTPTKDSGATLLVYHPGTYSVTADINGCSTTDSIRVFKKCYVDVPNVFTPNGDGTNDYFLPRELLSKGLSEFRMTLFNRWGVKVFETTSLTGRGWDGKFNGEDAPAGVYVYLIEAKFINGDSEKYQGNTTLLR